MKKDETLKKKFTVNSKMAGDSESCFATPGSIFAIIDSIHCEIAGAKHNKVYVLRFVPLIKQITKVLNGADAKFIRHAEFYSDLKETLDKIEHHIKEASTHGKWFNKLMAKKDQKSIEEFEHHVDLLITRIVFAFAQRVQLMKIARKKVERRLEAIYEDHEEIGEEIGEASTDAGEEEPTGER